MKLDRIKRRSGGSLILDITPLIDVVFLLLIFFLTATTFEDKNSGIKIDLPSSTIEEISDVKEIQILVSKEKEIYLNFKEKEKSESQKVDISTLGKILGEKLSNSKEKNVIISADKVVDYGFIVEIMTVAKESGAASLDIDTATGKK